MLRISFVLLMTATLSGCGGYYILTVPDQLAAAGGEATVIARLQRNDFFVMSFPVRSAAMRFRLADSSIQRAAHTDELGYAATTVTVPDKPGKYVVIVEHMDYEGEELETEAPAYVWDAEYPLVAVDLDALPGPWNKQSRDSARQALQVIAGGANVLYLTRRSVKHHASMHGWLKSNGYPDGPVLLWQREYWHVVRDKKWKFPRIVVESRLVSQIAALRKTFKNFRLGICTSALAARSFASAGLRSVMVGTEPVNVPKLIRRTSWASLARTPPNLEAD